jgi:hypothetical protein
MSLLEQYIDELTKDVEIDEFSLKECQMKLPAIKHKWVGRLIRHKRDLHRAHGSRRELVKVVVEKIKDSQEFAMTTPAAEKLAAKHEPIIKIDDDIRDLELVIEFLDKCEKIFHSMSFDIKNLVEIIKMETL